MKILDTIKEKLTPKSQEVKNLEEGIKDLNEYIKKMIDKVEGINIEKVNEKEYWIKDYSYLANALLDKKELKENEQGFLVEIDENGEEKVIAWPNPIKEIIDLEEELLKMKKELLQIKKR